MAKEPTFGVVIRRLRKAQNLSQEDLAFKSDLDRTYISILERGLKQPSLPTILRIAQALEILPSNLCKLIEEENTATEAGS